MRTKWDPPFMWEEGVCIYSTPGVHNNFPNSLVYTPNNDMLHYYITKT